ncbi:MAG: 3'(2'),5'-bisphosphate nucleotidase CysQ [Pseudomonadota bacterium]
MSDLDDVLRGLALEAGKAVMAVYADPAFEARAKSDNSPVTDADLAADRIIADGLAQAFPEIPAVTEEQAESHDQTGLSRFFLVDPLDGTKEFVQRRGDFTINIALIEEGRPTRGVVYAPAKGRLFRTKDGGAVQEGVDPDCMPVPGTETPITVREPDNSGLIVVASKSHRDKATDDFIAGYRVAEFTAAGSSLKFCLLAAGEADFYPRLGRTMEWDTAAGHAVLLAAGGHVLHIETRGALTYGKPGYANPFFLAYAEGVEL